MQGLPLHWLPCASLSQLLSPKALFKHFLGTYIFVVGLASRISSWRQASDGGERQHSERKWQPEKWNRELPEKPGWSCRLSSFCQGLASAW